MILIAGLPLFGANEPIGRFPASVSVASTSHFAYFVVHNLHSEGRHAWIMPRRHRKPPMGKAKDYAIERSATARSSACRRMATRRGISRCGCGSIAAMSYSPPMPAISAKPCASGGCRATSPTGRRCWPRSTGWQRRKRAGRACSLATTPDSGRACRKPPAPSHEAVLKQLDAARAVSECQGCRIFLSVQNGRRFSLG
jgi:hypothetical protein